MHTNEILVPLGEGVYAERSSRQACAILKRRRELLSAQLDASKTRIQELRMQVEFAEAALTDAKVRRCCSPGVSILGASP